MLEDLKVVAAQGGGRVICPECTGGSSSELSAAVYHSDHKWWVKCHRAACQYCRPIDGSHLIPFNEKESVQVYNGPILQLPTPHRNYLYGKYPMLTSIHSDLFHKYLKWNPERNTLLMPIRRDGKIRGWVERAGKDGENSIFDLYKYCGPSWSDKAKVWNETVADKGSLAWYPGVRENHTAVLVEDGMSALIGAMVSQLTFVALLGTGLNASKVSELYAGGIDNLRIALDKDATGQAFALGRKWGVGFDTCRVIPLDKDVKDMTSQEFFDMRWT